MQLNNLPSLVALDTNSCNDTSISALCMLKRLVLHGTEVTDHGVQQLTNLKSLRLSRSNISGEIVSQLNITSLGLMDMMNIKDYHISNMTQLKSLKLSWKIDITDNALVNLTNLTSLNLHNNRTITIEGIIHLNLKTLLVDSMHTIARKRIYGSTQLFIDGQRRQQRQQRRQIM